MEGVSAGVYKGLRGYWRRKGYQKLDGSDRRRKKRMELATMGGDSNRSGRRRFWRFKMRPKLRFWRGMGSPKKFFVKLRDAYVNMMMGIANTRVFSTAYGGALGEISGFGTAPMKEYDDRMIVEIYKALVLAQGQLVPRDTARIGTQMR